MRKHSLGNGDKERRRRRIVKTKTLFQWATEGLTCMFEPDHADDSTAWSVWTRCSFPWRTGQCSDSTSWRSRVEPLLRLQKQNKTLKTQQKTAIFIFKKHQAKSTITGDRGYGYNGYSLKTPTHHPTYSRIEQAFFELKQSTNFIVHPWSIDLSFASDSKTRTKLSSQANVTWPANAQCNLNECNWICSIGRVCANENMQAEKKTKKCPRSWLTNSIHSLIVLNLAEPEAKLKLERTN